MDAAALGQVWPLILPLPTFLPFRGFFHCGKKTRGKEKQTHLSTLSLNPTIVGFLVSHYFAWTAQPGVFGLLHCVSIVA